MRALSPGSPAFVGRDRELALLHDRLTAARVGRGSVVLISGEAGIGKTALADVLCRMAADIGTHVLAGHCYDRTETPPYGPWLEIARRVQAFPGAANAPPVPRLDGATSQADLFAQARDFLVAMTAQRPLLLVLEDLHWADSASLDLLRFIAQGLDDLPLLLVATYRDEGIDWRHPLAATVPLLVREAPTERLGLRPLDTAATEALVRARHDLGEAEVHQLATYLIERTEGNALFLTELLRSLAEDRQLDRLDAQSYTEVLAQTPVPLLLRQIVDDRLARLGDETATLLAVAAVVGQEVPLAVWQAVTQADEETLLAAAERAEAVHLVTASARDNAIQFTHALIRDVLYEDVSGLRRGRIHREVAEALAASPSPDPDAVAYHFQQAGDDRAVMWLVRAAERAEGAYALVTAAARYEAAFAVLDTRQGDVGERGWLRLLAAALRHYHGPEPARIWVEEAVRLAAAAQDASLAARAQAMRGLLRSYNGELRDGIADLAAAADAIEQLPPSTDIRRRREEQIDRIANRGTQIAFLAYDGRLTEARAWGERYLAMFAPLLTPAQIGAAADVHQALSMIYTLQGELTLATQSYAASIAAYDAIGHYLLALSKRREQLSLLVLPYQADDLPLRTSIADQAEQAAHRIVLAGGSGDTDPRYLRLPLLVLEGHWREARHIVEESETWTVLKHHYVNVIYGPLAHWQGDMERAWQCVREAWPQGPETEPGEQFNPLLQLQLLAAALALDDGDLPTARGWLDAHRRWLEYMDATLGRSDGHAMEAEWYRAAGDPVRARDHAAQALVHATAPRQPLALLAAHRILGILDTDAGDRDAAEGHFATALALADACRAPHERALTLLARAELAVAQGDIATATRLLDTVRAICTPMDARLALAHAERIAARLVQGAGETAAAPIAYPAGLTVREVEVLRLVAAGLSNAAIAERLFVSPNTVKAHVANVLAKIGVHNRAGATEYAIRHDIA